MELPQEIVDKFIEESIKRREQLAELLEALSKDSTDKSLYQPIYDIFHKIHGSAAIFGHHKLGEISGHLENYMNEIISKGKLLDESVLEYMKKMYELFEYCIEGRCDEEAFSPIIEELKTLIENL